jgi:galactokinase/mevalonate kinase-like predicted kinase
MANRVDCLTKVDSLLTNKPKLLRLYCVKQSQLAEVMSWMGKRSYSARVQRSGIERIREIARQNGKKGGRPRKEQKTTKL